MIVLKSTYNEVKLANAELVKELKFVITENIKLARHNQSLKDELDLLTGGSMTDKQKKMLAIIAMAAGKQAYEKPKKPTPKIKKPKDKR